MHVLIHHAAELWAVIRAEAAAECGRDPVLADLYARFLLAPADLGAALAALLAAKLHTGSVPDSVLAGALAEGPARDPALVGAAARDLRAAFERDPACTSYSSAFLFFKGFHALQTHRFAHRLWRDDRRALAQFLQNRSSEVFAVDIHPAASIGAGILLDHATGVVVGETAVIGDDVSLLHEVTLGGTGKDTGDRHPKIESGVFIGAGAKVLGNVRIGRGAKVGAGSVVVNDVAPFQTVTGVPAKSGRRSQPPFSLPQPGSATPLFGAEGEGWIDFVI